MSIIYLTRILTDFLGESNRLSSDPDPNLQFDANDALVSNILGLQAYLEEGLEKVTEEQRLEHFDFSQEKGKKSDDDKITRVFKKATDRKGKSATDKSLKRHFKNKLPRILDGANYKVTAMLSAGEKHLLLLANHRNTNEDVVIKMSVTPMDDKRIYELLKEYMFQDQAHQVLKETCRTPQPLGLIYVRKKEIYMMVSKFCPFLPGYYSVLTLKDALSSHATRPRLKSIEWRNICLSLISAAKKLQKNDIYHNNICHKNILLEVSDNHIVPVIIDFSKASRGERGTTTPLYEPVPNKESGEQHPAVAPELYEQSNPLPTSDLYSVAYLILKVSVYLKSPGMENYITHFRLQDPRNRTDHKTFYKKIRALFIEDIDARVDLTVDDMAPPEQGE